MKAITRVSILDPTCGSGAFLFAALNILEPIYTACLEAMGGFLDDLKRSTRQHSPNKLSDFTNVLKQVSEHASERYFILKSIIIDNLYGVDIMDEAVEICKLRLFLKLVAQLESYDQIEPLPDIDFNIRAGNTLVGFTSIEEVQEVLSTDLIKQTFSLPQIEERAEIADRAFRQFREMQTTHGMDADKYASAKLELKERLDDLREELDEYLAEDYGVKVDNEKAYTQWRNSHQPFHWFVEFYGIMNKGGFDVIIGNPPYVEYSKVRKEYIIRGFLTERCGNIFAFCTERGLQITGYSGRFCFIVPLSIQTTSRMGPLQEFLLETHRTLWISSFDVYPCKLFEGAKQRLSILNMSGRAKHKSNVWTTGYNRWRPDERETLFARLFYTESHRNSLLNVFPKFGGRIAVSILNKIDNCKSELFIPRPKQSAFYVHRIPYNYVKALNFIPYFWNEAHGRKKSEDYKPYCLHVHASNQAAISVISSNLFFFRWYSLFEGYHCGKREITSFPFGLDEMTDELRASLESLSAQLMMDLENNSRRKTAHYKASGKAIYQEFYPAMSKPIIDTIDCVLAEHYGFTDEELDFIINYDIKYRIGR